MGNKLFRSPTPSDEIILFPFFWNRIFRRRIFNPHHCSEETEIRISLQNPSRMHPAKLGKERFLQLLDSGNAMAHPFADKKFQPKRVTRKDGTVLYRNRLVPGSDLHSEFMNASKRYIRWMITRRCTHPRNKLQGSQCGCMMELEDADVKMLVMQQLAFFTQEKACREARIFEWIKSAWVNRTVKVKSSKASSGIVVKETHRRWKGRKFLFHHKVTSNRRGITKCAPHFVCVNALLQFYHIPYNKFKTYEEAIASGRNTAPAHLLAGRKSNKAMKEKIVEKLHDFFHHLEKNKTEPHATKVVRTTTGIALRNEDDIVELPSCFSKRQLYCQFLYGCGWVIKPKGNRSFGPIKEYELRKDSDDWVGSDENVIAPCSFEMFCCFWEKNYPKLQI